MNREQLLSKMQDIVYDLLADGEDDSNLMSAWISAGCTFLVADVLKIMEIDLIGPILIRVMLQMGDIDIDRLEALSKQIDVEIMKRILRKGA